MCYRCGICREVVQAGEKILRHTVTRRVQRAAPLFPKDKLSEDRPVYTREEVAEEIPACRKCLGDLLRMKTEGVPPDDALAVLRRRHHRRSGPKILPEFPTPRADPVGVAASFETRPVPPSRPKGGGPRVLDAFPEVERPRRMGDR